MQPDYWMAEAWLCLCSEWSWERGVMLMLSTDIHSQRRMLINSTYNGVHNPAMFMPCPEIATTTTTKKPTDNPLHLCVHIFLTRELLKMLLHFLLLLALLPYLLPQCTMSEWHTKLLRNFCSKNKCLKKKIQLNLITTSDQIIVLRQVMTAWSKYVYAHLPYKTVWAVWETSIWSFIEFAFSLSSFALGTDAIKIMTT